MKISYSLHGVAFAIEAEEPVAERVAAAVMPACGRARGARDATLFTVRRLNDGLAVLRGRRPLWHAASESELIPWLESEIVHWLLGRFRRNVQVHAAVVASGARAALIAGPPDSGKTSLACALGLAGWSVMSDEVALIEPRSSTVLSFPRAMLVKAGTARRLAELRGVQPRHVILEDGPQRVRYVNAESIGAKIRTKAKIRTIAFPEWARTASVEPMGECEALERLLLASFNTHKRPKLSIDTCVGLVRSAKLLRLRIGKLPETAGVLAEATGAAG